MEKERRGLKLRFLSSARDATYVASACRQLVVEPDRGTCSRVGAVLPAVGVGSTTNLLAAVPAEPADLHTLHDTKLATIVSTSAQAVDAVMEDGTVNTVVVDAVMENGTANVVAVGGVAYVTDTPCDSQRYRT